MYLITLYNRGIPVVIHSEFYRVADAQITREKNAISSLVFAVYPNNPGYEYVTDFASTITAIDLTTGIVEFDGRVISCVPSMDADGLVCKKVTCEDVFGYLCDSKQPYTEEKNWVGDSNRNGLQEFIDYVLANHNAHMPSEKRVYRGIVDVQTFATTENVTKGTNFERTIDLLHSKIIDVFGGEMSVRRGDDELLYLDYREILGSVSPTPLRIGYNMREASREVKPNQLITRLYPRGCKLSAVEVDENGNEREVETEDRLSISEANGGVEYIDDDEAIKIYGIIEGDHEWDDVTEPVILLAKATTWIKDNNRLPVSTTISGYDLSLIGLDAARFRIFDWYKCYNPLIGLDETLEIVRQTIDIDDPSESTFDMGESTALQSQKIATLQGIAGEVEYVKSQTKTNIINIKNNIVYTMAAIEVAEDRIVSTVGKQIVETSERIDGDLKVLASQVSTIEQTAESIKLNVEELTEDQQIMKSKIELMPDQITASVTKAYELYVDGEIKTVNTAISQVVQTADSIRSTVSSLQATYGTCTTASAVAAKSVSAPNFSLYKGATISVKFTYRNTASSPTLNVNGTGEKPIYVNGSAMASDQYWEPQDVLSFVYDGLGWRVADCGSMSSIAQLSDSISLKVSKGNVSSQLSVESGSISITSNRFSWTSNYSSMTKFGVLTCTSGKIGGFTITSSSIYNSRMSLTSTGLSLDAGGKDIGLIGANGLMNHAGYYGLNFDLESSGSYMTWAAKASQSDTYYTMKLTYSNDGVGNFTKGALNAGCDLDMHYFLLKRAFIDPNTGGANGGMTATINYVQVLGVNSDGTVSRWGPNARMVFKNGLLVDLTYYT